MTDNCIEKKLNNFEIIKGPGFLIFSLTGFSPHAERILNATTEFFKEYEIHEFSKLTVVFWELLTNAALHGNADAAQGRIIAKINHLQDRQFTVTVEDNGGGFDFQNLDMRLPEDPKGVKRRGYILINALSDWIKFNDKGNRITASVTLDRVDKAVINDTIEFSPILF
ncbi:MAG: ATP-binding protein [Planctomycetes bacterium]|nr:ATP-binding protein [Planctomycetota bacterium]